MSDDDIVERILSGKERVWRFTEQEQGGSSSPADRLLWLGILRAERELATIVFGGVREGPGASAGRTAPPSRFLKTLAQPLPDSFEALTAELGFYEDRGRESIVCDSGDGFVNKLRPMRSSSLSGYLGPLANLVYHNFLFPNERYELENIYASGLRYYMVLRQARVNILLNPDGYPVKPTPEQIRIAVSRLSVSFTELSSDEELDESTDSTDSTGNGFRMRFYNADYYLSDLQPGRNTVIDADTGAVRFIDPRITLNDPDGPRTSVSRFGVRKEDLPGQFFTS